MSDFGDVELSVAVRAIRNELLQAAAEGVDKDVLFEVGPIEMEFEVEIRHEIGAQGGVKAFLFSASADAKRAKGRRHRVSFTLTPKNATNGRNLEVGNNSMGNLGKFGSGQ
ncbi:trypco2 family protein [Streptomyces cyaneofuscatus]|uniref:trypco2 family protein n=1 Tax=Streptomyces griseus group TaxID=629295 RepID=UPI000996311F|nr:trypco2 family protein [Streptomyces microflavus]